MHARCLLYSPCSKPLFASSVTLSMTPSALLGFSDTLGRILLTDAQNKWRRSTGAHRQNSKLGQLDAKTLSIVFRHGAEQGHCHRSGRLLQVELSAHRKTNAECSFCLSPFFPHKGENLWISFSKRRQVLM